MRPPVPFRPERRKSASARPPVTPRPHDRGARLRAAAWAFLAAGAIGAAIVYWMGQDSSVAELLPASAREHRRQMGILYGTVGGMAVDLSQALRQPGTQALLLFAGCGISALICLRLSRSDL